MASRLNIFYTMIQNLNAFVEGKYDYAVVTASINGDYEDKRIDAVNNLESFGITKRIVSSCTSIILIHLLLSFTILTKLTDSFSS